MEDQSTNDKRPVTKGEILNMVSDEISAHLALTETNLIHHINYKMGQLELSMTNRMTELINSRISQHVDEAFPPGPLHHHKAQHQKHIDAAENTKRIKLDVQIWAVRGVVAFCFLLLGIGAKEWFLRELAK